MKIKRERFEVQKRLLLVSNLKLDSDTLTIYMEKIVTTMFIFEVIYL